MSNDKVQIAIYIPFKVREILKFIYIAGLSNGAKISYGDIVSMAVLEYAKNNFIDDIESAKKDSDNEPASLGEDIEKFFAYITEKPKGDE